MSAGLKKGGYTKIVYGTTPGLSTSTEITNLLAGTLPGEGTGSTVEDAAGILIPTGYDQPGEIRTSALSAAFITNLIAHKNNCQDLYFRHYATGGGRIVVGPVRVSSVDFAGAAPRALHQYIIRYTNFVGDATDIIEIEA